MKSEKMKAHFNLSLLVVALSVCGGVLASYVFITSLPIANSQVVILPSHHAVHKPVVAGVSTTTDSKLPHKSHNGQLLKFVDNPTVYLVLADGLHPFDSWDHYQVYTAKFGQPERLRLLTSAPQKFTVSTSLATEAVGLAVGS